MVETTSREPLRPAIHAFLLGVLLLMPPDLAEARAADEAAGSF